MALMDTYNYIRIMNFSSKLIEDAVNAFSSLPGIGKKSALRHVLHILKMEDFEVEEMTEAINKLKSNIQFCQVCHNISDEHICTICKNESRDKKMICVVENIRDLMAIENTQHFNGTYHVLGGLISPMEGIGPESLNIESLINRIEKEEVSEIIMALSSTIEGDTTQFYISRQLDLEKVNVSSIARGIAFGGELEYTDELTLAKSITNRLPYNKS
jgi:recombination protein RecR